MIFQDPRAHINPVRTIGDFMTEALRTLRRVGGAEARRRAAEALADVGIDDGARRLRQYPHELSGGLLQRVMIAAALLTEPRLLLADEPTTALDVTTQAEVMAILDELRRERGMALLFITHDLELAGAVCDRTSVMYAGQIVETRASALCTTDPLHPYTAALAGARPTIEATAQPADGDPGPPGARVRGARTAARSRRAASFAQDACRATRPPLEELDGGLVRCIRAAELRGRAAGGGAPCLRPSSRRRACARSSASVVAVDGVDLHVAAGGSLAIVGESGSGKTTVARMLVGLDRADRGDDHRAAATTARPRRGRRRSAAGAAARSRSSSRTRTRASTRARRRRAGDRRGPAPAPPARRRSSARPASPSSASWSASTSRQLRALPGALSRRPAPARRDRPRARRRAARADPRRVGRRARRLDPGPDPQPARRHPRGDRRSPTS